MGILEGILYMLWRGIAIGVIISAPMGPVGILCVQRTLAKGRRVGFYTGMGAAISDLLYCLVTGFGLSFIEEFLERNQNVIQIIGSVVLIGFGAYLFKSNPSRAIKKPEDVSDSPGRDIVNGFLFTVSNPLIIFLIIGLFARFNFLLPEILTGHYVVGFLCIIIGALAWWWMVTFFVDKVRAHFNLRSMWLINKITGSIIGIFGVVGIVTAIYGMAEARETETLYMNSARGFAPWEEGCVLQIDGNDTLPQREAELGGNEFSLRFRARNLHNLPGKRYATADGSRVMNPGWHIDVASPDDTVRISIRTIDDYRNELGPTALAVTVTRGDSTFIDTGLRDHLDWGTGWNEFTVISADNKVSLTGGERKRLPLAEVPTQGFAPSSVAICAEPGSLLELDWIELTQPVDITASMAYLAEDSEADEYLRQSNDPLEGIWEVYERSLDESKLTIGGDYRMLLVADGDGAYELIYLEGTKKYPGRWKPGMLKARLQPGSFKNIYNVTWVDVEGNMMRSDIKAQLEEPTLLTIQFPYQNSTLTLRRVTANR